MALADVAKFSKKYLTREDERHHPRPRGEAVMYVIRTGTRRGEGSYVCGSGAGHSLCGNRKDAIQHARRENVEALRDWLANETKWLTLRIVRVVPRRKP